MLKRWIIIALFFRFISAWTYSSWFHPDEWYQSIEFANLIGRGFGFYSQEFSLHLRNLLWPCLLAIPLKIVDFFTFLYPDLPVQYSPFALQFFIGLLDLGIFWGFWQLLRTQTHHLPGGRQTQKVFLAILLLPWFTIWDSIRPSSEHLSAIAIWLTLGSLQLRRYTLAGFCAVAIFAFRYPSGLFSLGVSLAVLIHTRQRLPYLLGIFAGFLLLGLPDAFIYGRPWESLWMYLQYNVFTGLSSTVFGVQSIAEYLEFFTWRWYRYGLNLPIGLCLTLLAGLGIWQGLRRQTAWSYGLVIYLLGHAAVPHKESRFMLSIFTVLLWASVEGFILAGNSDRGRHAFKVLRHFLKNKIFCRTVYAGTYLFLFLNGLLTLKALWGETWTPPSTYFDISHYLQTHANVCAIITPRSLNSVLLPQQTIRRETSLLPPLAIGWETKGDRRARFFSPTENASVQWYENPPQCHTDQVILLQLNFPEAIAENVGCTLLGSGILSITPQSQWSWIIEKNYSRGVWYRCKNNILNHLHHTKIVHPITTTLGHYDHLPAWGITGNELIGEARRALPPPSGLDFILHSF